MHSRSGAVGGALLLTHLLFASCSGGAGGGSSTPTNEFRVLSVSASSNAIWQINRPIEFRFSEPVDFLSVSSNTINIRSEEGVPATGSFFLKPYDSNGDGIEDATRDDIVVFLPSCPTRSDFSDAGIQPGGVTYRITVSGSVSGLSNSVRSFNGRHLTRSTERSFSTPSSSLPSIVFLDTTPGSPLPVLRTKGSLTTDDVTYVETGSNGSAGSRLFFEFDPITQSYAATAGPDRSDSMLALNLYADSTTSTAFIVAFNQAVNPADTNISDRSVRLEYLDANANWTPLDTRVELLSNCSGAGATIRLEPIGMLPAATKVRAVVLQSFQDIVGNFGTANFDRFAVAPTAILNYPSLSQPNSGSDEFLESFDFGGAGVRSHQDTESLFDSPPARWEDGTLSAAFDFDGTGGPAGNFDWYIRDGETFLFDTNFSSIVGGPDGIAATTQHSFGGVVDVRNLVIERGGTLRVQGPNALTLTATGYVQIDGTLNASGFNAKNVFTLGSGHLPEPGGQGAGGGGVGGTASSTTTSSTRHGDAGGGPYGEEKTGGGGGASGYSLGDPINRRPGGGGGGKLGPNFDPATPFNGRFAQRGYRGHGNSTSAVTGRKPAEGGTSGVGPLTDGDDSNDFHGIRPVVSLDANGKAVLVDLIRGELPRRLAGYGGGGGGDALPANQFPTPRWRPGSDEKAGGGGGGGGCVYIRALGEITFTARGLIEATGGRGGTGENVLGDSHVGGSGGGGSGGHVILESAIRIDLARNTVPLAPRLHFNIRGGFRTTGTLIGAPRNVSWGGGGGPGLIQLHVPSIQPPSDDPATSDIIVSTASLSDPDPYMRITSTTATQLIPTFGAQSKARSRWIPLGGADFDASGTPRPLQFLFGGVETSVGTDEGKILTTSGSPTILTPVLGPAPIDGGDVVILPDNLTLRISGSALDPLRNNNLNGVSTDLYLRTPALLRNFALKVEDPSNPSVGFVFDVADASFDEAFGYLDLFVTDRGLTFSFFDDIATPQYSLIPRFFRVRTGLDTDVLPDSAFVRFTFEAAGADALGLPDEENLLIPATGDLSRFNSATPGTLKFFRFEVEFNLDALNEGLSKDTKPVFLDFVRFPFRF